MSIQERLQFEVEALKQLIEFLKEAVRPVVTIMFTSAVVHGFLMGRVQPSEFLPVASLALGFYFQQRSNGNGAPPPTS